MFFGDVFENVTDYNVCLQTNLTFTDLQKLHLQKFSAARQKYQTFTNFRRF